MWTTSDIAVLAQELTPPSGTSDSANNSEVLTLGPSVTAILGTLILLYILKLIGSRIPGFKKFDDIFRLLVALLGITGVIAHTSWGRRLTSGIGDAINNGAANIDGRNIGFGVIAFILVIFGVVMYYNKASFGNLVIFTVLTLPLYSYEFLHPIVESYVEVIAQPVFAFIVGVGKYVVALF